MPESHNKMSIEKFGTIVSLLFSIITFAFTFGVLYGQVAENTKFREAAMQDMGKQREDLASIRTSVEYLVKESDEERQMNRERVK